MNTDLLSTDVKSTKTYPVPSMNTFPQTRSDKHTK